MTAIDRTQRRRCAGTSTVEMALVLPLLLILVFAIGEFGVAFTQWQTLTNAAREGARVGVLFRGPDCNAGAVTGEIQQTVDTYVAASGLTLGDVALNPAPSGVCGGSGTPLTVNARVPYQFQVLPGLAGLQTEITLGATSVMRNE
jgi:Flp pilus assembly protein TadG